MIGAARFAIPFQMDALTSVPSVLVFNPPQFSDLSILGDDISIECDRADDFHHFHGAGFDAHPRVQTGQYDRALVFINKHSALSKAMIGRAWNLVREGGDILVEGAKNEGVDSIIRGLRALGLSTQVEPKAHGKIVWFTKQAAGVGAIDAWAAQDASFVNKDEYHVHRGVFSADAIDAGTQFLLDNLPDGVSGKVADFGGGYGAISLPLLRDNPNIEALDFYEISALACESARANIHDPRAHIHWLAVEEAAKNHYDFIVSNPPFHKGRTADPEIGRDFVRCAALSLRARGKFYMVANRHLPYEYTLNANFAHVELFAENRSFKIFKASRPKTNQTRKRQ